MSGAPLWSSAWLGAVLLAAAWSSAADGLPRWAEPHLEARAEDESLAVLWRGKSLTVADDGSLTTRSREVLRVDDAQGVAGVPRAAFYDDDTQVLAHDLWVVDPVTGETVHVDRGEATRHAAPSPVELETDRMVELLPLPGGVVGKWVIHESLVREAEPFLTGSERLSMPHPVHGGELRVEGPKGWPVSLRSEFEGRVEGGWARFEEIDAIEADEVPPRVFWRVRPPEGHPARARYFHTWEEVGAWWWGLSGERFEPSPEVRELAGSLGALEVGKVEYVQRVTERVRREIRYVAKEVGIDGYRPRAAGTVLANRYGDCKDMTALAVSLLRVGGVRALPALVRVWSTGDLEPKEPGPHQFNHAIVYLPVQADSGLLAEPLWFDATSDLHPLGDVPAGDEGTLALVVEEDGRGRLEQIPLSPAAANGWAVEARGLLLASGDAVGELEARLHGEVAAAIRALMRRGGGSGTRRQLREALRRRLPQARLEVCELQDPGIEAPLSLECAFHLPAVARPETGGQRIDLASFCRPSLETPAGENTIRYPYRHHEDLRIRLESGLSVISLPAPVEVRRDFARWHRRVDARPGGLTLTCGSVVTRRSIPAAAMRGYLAEVATREGAFVRLADVQRR